MLHSIPFPVPTAHATHYRLTSIARVCRPDRRPASCEPILPAAAGHGLSLPLGAMAASAAHGRDAAPAGQVPRRRPAASRAPTVVRAGTDASDSEIEKVHERTCSIPQTAGPEFHDDQGDFDGRQGFARFLPPPFLFLSLPFLFPFLVLIIRTRSLSPFLPLSL